jgi:S-adenosyl methyltransferase
MVGSSPDAEAGPPSAIDTTVPNSARIWNYWLGGKDNYAVDRAAGDQFLATYPGIAVAARASRAFQGRAVRYLAGQAGIRQFLDIGTGLPTADSTHQVAQAVAPESRIVYVDNDPVVLSHAAALLTGTAEGRTAYIDADLRDPEKIIQGAASTLDLGQPVAVMLLGILGHVTDDGEARSIVRRLLDPMPAGSHLVLSDGTSAVSGRDVEAAIDDYNETGAVPYCLRTPGQLARFFDGLDLVEPGLVSCPRWRPPVSSLGGSGPAESDQFCGVGRKP